MDIQNVDRSLLKSVVREIILEDVSIFKETIKEILQEHKVIGIHAEQARKERLEQLIEDDFKKYDEVFKALA